VRAQVELGHVSQCKRIVQFQESEMKSSVVGKYSHLLKLVAFELRNAREDVEKSANSEKDGFKPEHAL